MKRSHWLASSGGGLRRSRPPSLTWERSPRSAPVRLNYAKALIAAGKRGDAKKQLEEIAALPAAPAVKEEAAKLLAGL